MKMIIGLLGPIDVTRLANLMLRIYVLNSWWFSSTVFWRLLQDLRILRFRSCFLDQSNRKNKKGTKKCFIWTQEPWNALEVAWQFSFWLLSYIKLSPGTALMPMHSLNLKNNKTAIQRWKKFSKEFVFNLRKAKFKFDFFKHYWRHFVWCITSF